MSVEPEEGVLYNTDAIFFRTRAELELNLSDGRTLDLGSGGKYYDDIDWDTPPSCEELVDKATVPTRATLMGQALEDEMGTFEPEFRTLNSMYSWAMGGQDCMDSANLLSGDTPSAVCREMHYHYQRFVLEPDPQRDMDGETFRRLVDVKAPSSSSAVPPITASPSRGTRRHASCATSWPEAAEPPYPHPIRRTRQAALAPAPPSH